MLPLIPSFESGWVIIARTVDFQKRRWALIYTFIFPYITYQFDYVRDEKVYIWNWPSLELQISMNFLQLTYYSLIPAICHSLYWIIVTNGYRFNLLFFIEILRKPIWKINYKLTSICFPIAGFWWGLSVGMGAEAIVYVILILRIDWHKMCKKVSLCSNSFLL